MTQQIPSRSKLGKGFLIVGLVLLIVGFFFFGLVSADSIHTTKYSANVNISTSKLNEIWSFVGYIQEVEAMSFSMKEGDTLSVEVHGQNLLGDMGNESFLNIYIILFQGYGTTNKEVLDYSNSTNLILGNETGYHYFFYLDYLNVHPQPIEQGFKFEVFIASPEVVNQTLNVVTTVKHYGVDFNDWLFFGTGLLLSSLSVALIFKSKKS